MILFYLIGAIFFTVIILVISFENIQASCNYMVIFFKEIDSTMPPTFLIFGVALLGMITGAFFFGFLHALFSKGSKGMDDEDENF